MSALERLSSGQKRACDHEREREFLLCFEGVRESLNEEMKMEVASVGG